MHNTAAKTDDRPVSRRRVFYIPGYDPVHPRRYRELYRSEAALQGDVSEFEVALTAKTGPGAYGWHVDMDIDEELVQADFDVLVWSDLVRNSMSRTIPATYWQMVKTSWTYISTGAFRRLAWLRKGPVLAALYPVAMLLFQLLVAVVLAIGLGWATTVILTAAFTAFAALLTQLGFGTGTDLSDYLIFAFVMHAAAWAVQIIFFIKILRWFQANDGKFFAHYLMHDFAYSAHLKGANPPELETRLSDFGNQIARALQTDVDEVLVVGHSSGAHLAISVLADLIRAGRVPADGPALAFLSLGQVVPMMSFLPEAGRLRGDLAYLSVRPELTWVDVTAPGDGCSFALCDPVAVSGVRPPGAQWPIVMSAAFTNTLQPDTWANLRWRFFRLHFQYLCHFDNPGAYDYFQITAGPRTLSDRFGSRASSQGRIDVPASKYINTVDPLTMTPAE